MIAEPVTLQKVVTSERSPTKIVERFLLGIWMSTLATKVQTLLGGERVRVRI